MRLTPSLLAYFFLGFKHLQNTTLRIKFLTNKLGLSCAKLSYGSYLFSLVTICWLNHVTMLNACAQTHAFASLTQWKWYVSRPCYSSGLELIFFFVWILIFGPGFEIFGQDLIFWPKFRPQKWPTFGHFLFFSYFENHPNVTICWLNDVTMLNACAQAHVFASLTQWKW